MRKGFTLVELLIVIILIAVLAAIAIPRFASQKQTSKEAALKRSLWMVREAPERFHADTGAYPQRLSRLNDLPTEFSEGTFPVLERNGTWGTRPAADYRGPYLGMEAGSKVTATQPNPLGGTFTSNTQTPIDPISGLPYNYRYSNGRVNVTSSATGRDSRGIQFSQY